MDLNLFRTFLAVAESARIAKAAAQLGLPKSTVSRHIARLERSVGAALFLRRSDGFELTAVGRRLFQATRDAVRALSAPLDAPRPAAADRPIRVHAPALLGRGLLSPIFAAYLAARERVSLDVRLGTRFELPSPTEVDLLFLVGTAAGRDFETWSLGSVESRLYAAPTLFARSGPPKSPAELQAWPIITENCSPGSRNRIQLTSAHGELSVLLASPRIVGNDPDLLIDGARAGLGILRIASFLAAPLVRTGELVAVLPEWHADRHAVSVARSLRADHPAVADLADFAATRLRTAT
jgi:DNA-binding transcriptional LysR family regulator